MTIFDEGEFLPTGGAAGKDSADLVSLFRDGKKPEPGTQQAALQAGADPTVDAQDLLTGPFDGDEPEEEERGDQDAPEGSWLDTLLGTQKGTQEAEQEGAEGVAPPAQNQPQAQPKLDPAFVTHVQAGGDPAEFYRQRFATEAQQAPAQPQAQQPAQTPEQTELSEIATARTALVRKRQESYIAFMDAQQRGDEAAMNELTMEQMQFDLELGNLANRAQQVNTRAQQSQRQSVRGEYSQQFTQMLKQNHGVSDEARLAQAAGRVLEVDWLGALMDNEKTFPLMQNPVVREIMVKAALYDMQYGSKRAPRQAPADPGTQQSAPQGAPRQGARTGGNMMSAKDGDFANMMTRGKPAKGGK